MAPVMEGKAADAGDIKPFFHLLVFDDTQDLYSWPNRVFGIDTGLKSPVPAQAFRPAVFVAFTTICTADLTVCAGQFW